MSQAPDLSTPEAVHRYFSVYCFNHTWDLLDKTDRSAEDDEAMVQSCLASLWHWNQRPDCTDQNRSIGTWQAARVYAVLKLPEIARRYAQMALDFSIGQPPFYQAYAYEALARAEAAAGNHSQAEWCIEKSSELAKQVEEAEDRKLILEDLKTII